MGQGLILLNVAGFVIIAAGVSAAQPILVPFLLAIFISIIISPILDFLERLKMRRSIAFVAIIAVFVGILWFLGSVVGVAINDFSTQLPKYQAELAKFGEKMVAWINSYEFIKINSFMIESIDTTRIFGATSALLMQTGQIATKSFLVFLLVIFMLAQAQIFKDKVAYFSRQNAAAKEIVTAFISDLKRYLAIKTASSIATGLILWGFLAYFSVPYASLWAILAFILNYIPTIGSIIAAIPAILMSLIANDLATTAWLAVIYLVVNIAIGNFIEPKFLGARLGISTLVVILSLIFWGFLLGVGGMFLAVPLTMSIKIALNQNPRTKFLAILLSDKVE